MHDQRSFFGNMVHEYAVRRIRALNKERTARIEALRTREDAEKYVTEVRGKVRSCFSVPADRSVPEVELCGTVEREKFTVEKIIYYSRENFGVTANLYLPKTPGKHPAVLFLCGHSANGKAADAYQCGAQNLALQGYVVLVPDPISQGERWQFADVPHAQGINGQCCCEHSMLGRGLRLCGDYFGNWRAHDALKGLDYLLSRSEVDPARVGVTGNSGGGTMTSFLNALDDRFTMAAPSCYITSWRRNIENEFGPDVEQIPPNILAQGCEMGDLILAQAPRPVLLLGQKNDFFDHRGLIETYTLAKKVYELLDAGENLQYFIGPTNHGYSIENREAMYKFFARHAHIQGDVTESDETEMIPESELRCTLTGQLLTSHKELATVSQLVSAEAEKLTRERPKLSVPQLKEKLRQELKLPEKIEVPYSRILRPFYTSSIYGERITLSRFALEGEEGLLTTLKLNRDSYFFHFPKLEKLTLYLPHLDAGSEVLKIDRGAEEFYAGFDYRNTGESLTLTGVPGDEYRKFTSTYNQEYHYDSIELMFGSSMIACRVLDTLRAIEFLKANEVAHLHLAARGLGSFPALFAALLSDKVESLTLYDAPGSSYLDMAKKRITRWPQSVMVPGILKYTDLPEICEAIKTEKTLNIINSVNEPVPEV